jgi:hypothetical protein
MLLQIDTWEMQQIAYLLGKMKQVDEGGQNLLYNSAVFVSSDVSDGDRHNHDDMPVLLAGHGGGSLSPGQHVWFPSAGGAPLTSGPTPPSPPSMPREKVSNLLLTMIGTVGASGPLGDSTGPLRGL